MKYQIAGLIVCISEIRYLADFNWQIFLTGTENEELVNIQIYIKKQQDYSLEKYELGQLNSRSTWLCFRYKQDIFLVDFEWENAKILAVHSQESFDVFMNQLFYSVAVKKQMLQIHSSLVDYKGRGLMFLGPSGIGKTTQAELWNKYRDALIINGDVVFVQETPDAFLGWGTPWHGSSPYCENANVPVRAMIVLKQAEENSIRELTGFEKVTAVSESVFYPRWLEGGMELCLETLDHLLTAVPVYELRCRPDEDAVRITEEAVFG